MKPLYGFNVATGDVDYLDYGGTWYRRISEHEYHFIRLLNWEDACGEREAAEIGETYNMQLAIVNLAETPDSEVRQALKYFGLVEETEDNEFIALACFEYGCHAPVEDTNTSNFHATFRRLAALSRSIRASKSVRRRVMARKVNKIGSTASEFMKGDITSAIVRGVIAKEPNALLMAKVYGACAK